jgi:integrase/recombinase XerD
MSVAKRDKRTGRVQIRERNVDSTSTLVSYGMEDALQLFLTVKEAQNLKQRTRRDYETNMRYFIEWIGKYYGEITVDDISIKILREYVLWCANEKEYYGGHPFKSEVDKERKGLSPASVNVRIRVLKAFFNTMAQEGVIIRNPCENLSLMRQDIDTVQPLTEDELRRLLVAPDQKYYAQFRDYCILMLIVDTGMRINEICALELRDIDLRTRQIVLPAIKNKNRKPRVLPLSAEITRLLMQLTTESRQYFDSAFVFNTNYGEPINEKTIQKAIAKYAKKACITKRVSPHVLRHNFAKMAAMNGMDVFTLMRILGHSDISTTRKYVQIDDDDVKEQHKLYSPIQRIMKRK